MSFWTMNDGQQAEAKTTYETEDGNLEPIPANTGCIAAIEEAKWDEYEGDRYISLKWRIMRPEAYGNRVIFQKVKVHGTSRDKDPAATADKAKRMLAAIDANAGGRLIKLQSEPDDTDLMTALVGKPMAIKLQIWKMTREDGEKIQGNWISAVAPAKNAPPVPPKPVPQAALATPAEGMDFEDDIPFS